MADDHARSIEIIRGAIEQRHRVALVYKDDIRIVEPYILGYDPHGKLVLSAVQVLGGSGPGFRSFAMEDIASLAMTDEKFSGNHPDYNPRDRLFSRVLCQV
jgi:predicted DNA-binding transcriptional regulator YafY